MVALQNTRGHAGTALPGDGAVAVANKPALFPPMSLDCKASMQRTVHIAPPSPCNGKSPLVANEGKVTDETLTRQGGTSYSDQWVPLHGP
jgi:hypothetical protein